MWNNRYDTPEYIFGKEPNEFLRSMAKHIPQGAVLCVAEGEGRNAVYLAAQGYQVTAVDSSTVGLAKASRLAAERGVSISTIVADLRDFHIRANSYSGVVSIFCHLSPDLRSSLFGRIIGGLRPGGIFILEAYTPKQLDYKTGGPSTADLLMTLEDLRAELQGLDFIYAQELERNVVEGINHTGLAHVVQLLAIKPASGL
jgi:SAM-dependent methyltransferase